MHPIDAGMTRKPKRRMHYCDGMAQASNAVTLMTVEQAALLRKLAFDAYKPEAFSPTLTKTEAERRIIVLRAKMKLMSEPPHTQ